MFWKRLVRSACRKPAGAGDRSVRLYVEALESREVPTATPYVVPAAPGVATQAILTTGDSIGGYRMAGIPDGLGAFDNGDGTFTLLVNHELGFDKGAVHDHGAAGAFVSKWIINKSDLSVVSGDDLIQQVYDWNVATQSSNTFTSIDAFNRFCSADLPSALAFVNPSNGNGTTVRIYMNGEESDGYGKALANIVTGPDAGKSFVLGKFNLGTNGSGATFTAAAKVTNASTSSNMVTLATVPFSLNLGQSFLGSTVTAINNTTKQVTLAGNANEDISSVAGVDRNYVGPVSGAWENLLANPNTNNILGDKTVVIGDSDGGTGIMNNAVAVYVGTKTSVGTPADRAGLTNGVVKFINVTGNAVEIANTTTRATNITNGTRFTLSATASTTFSRPEDGAWNPFNPNQYYFVTTDRLDQASDGLGAQIGQARLWRITFDDITNPDRGGKIDLLIDGRTVNGQKVNMFDNITVNPQNGHLIILEDVGNSPHNGKVWDYDPTTDALVQVARHDPARFGDVGTPATFPFTQDEETSGVIDVSSILGPGTYLFSDQAHFLIDSTHNPNAPNPNFPNPDELVEGGQLLLMHDPSAPVANADTYNAVYQTQLNVNAEQGVLANDSGSPLTVLGHTDPAHGSLTLNADGSFGYTPNAGFVGPDSFTYTAAAVQVYKTNLPPLGTFGGVSVGAGAFGSAVVAVPGTTDEVYGLTDRGPNVDNLNNGTKVEPIPSFTPAIGRFRLINGQAVLQETITLKAADGTPYNGRVNTDASTGEIITDLNGIVLPASPYGFDPEGIVALADGSFWVSDEYGPFIRHFDNAGFEIEADRLAPGHGLPGELSLRRVNRGMEGLTITPDGTLVGIMQSSLINGISSGDTNRTAALRIVTYKAGVTHEYLYLLDSPANNGTAVSEITALSDTTFLIDERDGLYAPTGYKKLFKIDISGATDVGPNSPLINGTTITYSSSTGLMFGANTIEKLVQNQATATAAATLAANGVTAAAKSLYLDLSNLLQTLDPSGKLFSHDKIEGITMIGGNKLVISNDSDFGIDGITNSSAPFQLHAKTSPATGAQDNGEYLVIDLSHLNAPLSTTIVTVNVSYAVQDLTSKTKPVKSGSSLPIELLVTDGAGRSVGAPNLPVTAVDIVGPGGQHYTPNDAGNSNPNGLFRFDPSTGKYKFNLKSTGLPAGKYTLFFSIGNDPTLHPLTFEVF